MMTLMRVPRGLVRGCTIKKKKKKDFDKRDKKRTEGVRH